MPVSTHSLSEPVESPEIWEILDQSIASLGLHQALPLVIADLTRKVDARPLLEALLLQARWEMGLDLVLLEGTQGLTEAKRSEYEDRSVAAIRQVGQLLLDCDRIREAWPYFQMIGEHEPVGSAIQRLIQSRQIDEESAEDLIAIALWEGADPVSGYRLILEHQGTCASVTAFDHLPGVLEIRRQCAGLLVNRLTEEVSANLRADLVQRTKEDLEDDLTLDAILDQAIQAQLFAHEEVIHVDASHLASTVRLAPLLEDPESLRRCIVLARYGSQLAETYRFPGDPPFERTYDDQLLFLRGLLGEDDQTAIRYFQAKLDGYKDDEEPHHAVLTAQVLVRLLLVVDNYDLAVEISGQWLADVPESSLICPGLHTLCIRHDRIDSLRDFARQRGDLVTYLTAWGMALSGSR